MCATLRPAWIWTHTLVFFAVTTHYGAAQFGTGNAPPTVSVERTWEIDDNVEPGQVFKRVKAADPEGDTLEFSLETREGVRNPFIIDPVTGAVKLNESISTRGGENFVLSVQVTDGGFRTSNEVLVQIINSSATPLSRPPSRRPLTPLFYPPLNHPGPPLIPAISNPVPPRLLPVPPSSSPKPRIKSTHRPKVAETTSTSTTTTEADTTTVIAEEELPDRDLTYILIPVSVISVLLLVLILLVILFRKRIFKNRNKIQKEDMRKDSSGGGGLDNTMAMHHWRGPQAFSNRYEGWDDRLQQPPPIVGDHDMSKPRDKWEFPRHRLKVFNILGEGCFGQVWRCEALDIDGKEGTTVVAVKTLKENAGEKERSDLLQELEVMKSLEPHANVVRLLACCTDKDPLFVIMEFVANGKLQSYLRNSRAERYYGNMHGQSKTLTSKDLTSFAYQCARGMEFLSSNGIIHRDIAARNILVSEDQVCKVADFGFARDVTASLAYERKSEGKLPIRWMAPESLYDNIFTVKSDVWGFGVLVWEMVTLGSTPYPGLAAADVMRRVRDGYRLEKPEHCRRELYNIMFYCWDKDPNERPSFSELVNMLEQLLLTETDYIELERFPDHSYYNMVSLSGEKL